MLFYIKGNLDKKIYHNNENGFMVGVLKIKETNCDELENEGKVTFTGFFAEIKEKDDYILNGNVTLHPKYGNQFSVESYERIVPNTKEKLIEFLSSDIFPGIGIKQATKIVEVLGENAIEKIVDDKDILINEVKLPSKKAESLYDNLIKYEESHKLIVYLTENGFTTKEAIKIYNFYGSGTVNQLEHNIYSLIDDIKDIGFIKIDRLAPNFGFQNTSSNRVQAGIVYVMSNICFKTGNTYLEYDVIKKNVEEILNIYISDEDFNKYLEELEMDLKIVKEEENYYLYEYYEAEVNITSFIKVLSNKINQEYKSIDMDVKKLEKENNIEYNDTQKEAIKKALTNNILIITGGPGTGKTTIIKAIVELYKKFYDLDDQELDNEIALLAPTGRASKRLGEGINASSSTIHRFLKWNKDVDEFMVNEHNKSDVNLVIVDEASMIDLLLFDNLIKGLKSKVKLIVVGDFHQLPSVAPGQILKDLISSESVDTIHLNLLYRQDSDSFIPELAHNIKDGNFNDTFLERYDDYKFLECSSKEIIENIIYISEKIISKGYNYRDFQIMAPIYRGINGIDNLNKHLQNVYNPKNKEKREIKYGNVVYRVGDKVIQLVNNPDDGIYNGDVGIIDSIKLENETSTGKKEIYIDYDGNVVLYMQNDLINIKHAFVISIHKSQGSEFDMVLIPMCLSYGPMLYRRLIYTAVTRAKRKLFILGNKQAFELSIKNEHDIKRKSELSNRIMNNL